MQLNQTLFPFPIQYEFYIYSSKTTSKGRANYLLKKASILNSELRPPSKYKAGFKEYIKYKEDGQQFNDDDFKEERKNHIRNGVTIICSNQY